MAETVRAVYCNIITWQMTRRQADNEFCDVDVRVGQYVYKCHRLVLSSASDYFNVMFKGRFNESPSQEVVIPDLDARVFEEILRFMYTGQAVISKSNLFDIIRAADFYGIPCLVEFCMVYIRANVNEITDVILKVFWYAHSTRMNVIVQFLKRHIYENFGYFLKVPEFVNLSVDSLLEILVLTTRMPVRPFQDLFFEGIHTWIRGQQNVNQNDLLSDSNRLLAKIDRTHFSSEYAERLVMLASADGSPDRCVHAPNVLRNGPKLLRAYVSPISRSGLPKGVTSIFTGFSSPFANPWAYSGDVEHCPYEYLENIIVDDYIYSLGYSRRPRGIGLLPTFRCSTSLSMNPSASLELPPFDYGCDLCGFANEIYLYNKYKLCRSFHGGEPSRNLFFYKRDIDRWFPLPYPRIKVASASMTYDAGRLYLFGGSINSCGSTNLVQAYDIRTNEWLVLPPTRYNHFRNSCCVYGKGIIVVDDAVGRPSSKGEIYDPIAGRSRSLTDSNDARRPYPNFVNWSGQLICYDRRDSCADKTVLYYSDTAQYRDWVPLPNMYDVIAEIKFIPRHAKVRILDIVSF